MSNYNQAMQEMQQALDAALAANSNLEQVMAKHIQVLFEQNYEKRYEIQHFIATAKSKMVQASKERAANIEMLHRNTLHLLAKQRAQQPASARKANVPVTASVSITDFFKS